jgi:hypothetical protein
VARLRGDITIRQYHVQMQLQPVLGGIGSADDSQTFRRLYDRMVCFDRNHHDYHRGVLFRLTTTTPSRSS